MLTYFMIESVFFDVPQAVFNINTSIRPSVLKHGEGFDIQQGRAGLMN